MRLLGSMTVAVVLTGCGGGSSGPATPSDVMERHVFVEIMVELRLEALDNTPMVVTEGEKEAILSRRGVTEEDLRAFVEAHGRELEFMRDLWADIEARILNEIDPEAAADSAVQQS